jgi:hypothetical protein
MPCGENGKGTTARKPVEIYSKGRMNPRTQPVIISAYETLLPGSR